MVARIHKNSSCVLWLAATNTLTLTEPKQNDTLQSKEGFLIEAQSAFEVF